MKIQLLCLIGCLTAGCAKGQTRLDLRIIDNRPFVQAEVNGATGFFLVDSGGRIGLDTAFANKAGVPMLDSLQIRGAGDGQQWAWYGPALTIGLSDASVRTTRSLMVDLRMIRDSLNLPYLDGVIGVELFRKYRVTLDYRKWTMTLQDPDQPVNLPDEAAIPFTFYRGQIPQISPDGPVKGDFLIDTGDRFTLTMFRAPESAVLSEARVTGYGIGGAIRAQTFTLPRFGPADWQLENVLVRVPRHQKGSWANEHDVTGSIGSGLLSHFRVTFDYHQQKIWMEPYPDPGISEFVYHTDSPEVLADWYASRLPFKVVTRSEGEIVLRFQQARIRFVREPGTITLHAFQAGTRTAPPGVFKFGFTVADIDKLRSDLETLMPEVAPIRILRFSGYKMFLLRDPEGNMLQFFQGAGDNRWKNSFVALITGDEGEYDRWVDRLIPMGFKLASDFSRPDGPRQQNYVLGGLSIELLLIEDRVKEPPPSVTVSGVDESTFWKALDIPARD